MKESDNEILNLLSQYRSGDIDAGWKLVMKEYNSIRALCKTYRSYQEVDREELINEFILHLLDTTKKYYKPDLLAYKRFVQLELMRRSAICERLLCKADRRTRAASVKFTSISSFGDDRDNRSDLVARNTGNPLIAELNEAIQISELSDEAILAVEQLMLGSTHEEIQSIIKEKFGTTYSRKALKKLIDSSIAELQGIVGCEGAKKLRGANSMTQDEFGEMVGIILTASGSYREATVAIAKQLNATVSIGFLAKFWKRYNIETVQNEIAKGRNLESAVAQIVADYFAVEQIPPVTPLTDKQWHAIAPLVAGSDKPKQRERIAAVVHRALGQLSWTELAAVAPGIDCQRVERQLKKSGVYDQILELCQ